MTDLRAWERHLRCWPPADSTAVVALALQAAAAGLPDVARHLGRRFPGAFDMLGLAPPEDD